MFFSFLSYFQCVLCWCFLFIRATGFGIQWGCKWFAFGLLSECRMWRWHSGYLLVFGWLVGWHISVRTCVPTVHGSVCCCSRALGSNLISQPPVRFWGSDVHRQRSQLPLCLPLETPHLFSLPSLPLFCCLPPPASSLGPLIAPHSPSFPSVLTSIVCLTFLTFLTLT